jgi:hypothetical protein
VDPTLGSEDILSSKEDTLDLEDHILDLVGDYWNHNKNRNSIFRLSKQISEETLDILYGENIFKLYLHGEGEVYLKKYFTEANRRRMRYFLLAAVPSVSYDPGRMPDNALWSSILPTLKELRIVTEQPIAASLYYGAPTLEQETDCWVKWFGPFLQCFGQYLSRETIVQVDFDGRAETRDLVKEYMPRGYQEIQCHHVGDLIFKRGRFSWESGYWDDDDRINSCDADGDWDSD